MKRQPTLRHKESDLRVALQEQEDTGTLQSPYLINLSKRDWGVVSIQIRQSVEDLLLMIQHQVSKIPPPAVVYFLPAATVCGRFSRWSPPGDDSSGIWPQSGAASKSLRLLGFSMISNVILLPSRRLSAIKVKVMIDETSNSSRGCALLWKWQKNNAEHK